MKRSLIPLAALALTASLLTPAAASCFPPCGPGETSIAAALDSVGADSSYAYRARIAAANGITGYSGTAEQNIQMLGLLKNGQLNDPDSITYFPRYTGSSGSIAAALDSVGADSSYAYRARVAAANGITSYSGTAEQNTRLLAALKNGTLKRPEAATPAASGNVQVLPQGRENQPALTNAPGQRSAQALNAVLDQFQVESNVRYQRTQSATYCNIFVWDCTRALGCEIPHWLLSSAPASSSTPGAYEINTNATYNWLNAYGSRYGWRQVSAYEAQRRANAGYPAIAIWKNPTGQSGHIAMVRPEGGGYAYSAERGAVIAQAGAANYNRATVSLGFGRSRMPDMAYWTHD